MKGSFNFIQKIQMGRAICKIQVKFIFGGHLQKFVLFWLFFYSEVLPGDTSDSVRKILVTLPTTSVGSKSDGRSRDREFDPGPVPYFHGD